MITVNTTLDFTRPNDIILHAKQNDRLSRSITTRLVENDMALSGMEDYAAIIRYRKPDGTGGAYDVDENGDPAIVVTGSTAVLTLAEQVLLVPGNVDMELNFYNSDGEKVTSFRWILAVEESAYDDGGIVSSDYFNILTAQIASAIQAAEDAAESAEAAEDAAESIVVDTALSPTSENPVQNKVIYQALQSAGAVSSVNGQTGAVTLGAADVGAVPTTRKVNGKALSSDITLSASDVGARPAGTPIGTSDISADAVTSSKTIIVPITPADDWEMLSNTYYIDITDEWITSDCDYIVDCVPGANAGTWDDILRRMEDYTKLFYFEIGSSSYLGEGTIRLHCTEPFTEEQRISLLKVKR